MGDEPPLPETTNPGELAAASVRLKDTLGLCRKTQRTLRWGALIPGSAAVAYFLGTAFFVASPEPSITLAAVFGGGLVLAGRKYRRLGLEVRDLKEEIERLEAPSSGARDDS